MTWRLEQAKQQSDLEGDHRTPVGDDGLDQGCGAGSGKKGLDVGYLDRWD